MTNVRVLGDVAVWADGGAVDLGGRLPTRLLVALVARSPDPVSVDRLLADLWDDQPDIGSRRLRTLVNRLRRSLAPVGVADLVATVRDGYRWTAPELVDLHRYQELSAAATRESLEAALELWRGEPFAPFTDEPWLAPLAATLVERHCHDTEQWAQLALDEGRAATLLPHLRAATAAEPLREVRWAQLVTALDRAGRRSDALRAYTEARAVLADQLGARPGPQLQAAYEAVLAPAPIGRSPVRPGALGTLVGRDAELEQVDALLDRCRLVTIAGLGGVGKSRLAEEVVRRWRQRGRVVAEGVVHPGSSAPALAASLARQAGHGSAPLATADRVLATAMLGVDLLVVDAAEHDPSAAEVVARLQANRPHLAVLVTSRVPLGLAEEVVVTLEGLPVPGLDDPWEGTAAELLLRAGGAAPHPPADASARAEVLADCRRAGGIPLALELLGRSRARGGAHTAGEGGAARVTASVLDALATIEPAATATARTLAALPDGIGTPLLAATCGADEADVARHLLQLNRLALATSTAASEGLRVRLADPVADALATDLGPHDRAGVLSRFAAAVADACAQRRYRTVLGELVGIEAALRSAASPVALARVVAPVWGLRGDVATGLRWLPADEDDPLERARTVVARARVLRFGSAMGDEIAGLDEATEVLAAAADPDAWVVAASAALAWTYRGAHDDAAARLARARALVDPDDEWAAGLLGTADALVTANRGDLDAARAIVDQAIDRLLRTEPGAAAQPMWLKGTGSLIFDGAAVARPILAEARMLADEAGDAPLLALIGLSEASAAAETDAPDTAPMFRRTARDLEQVGLTARAAVARRAAGLAFADEGNLDDAMTELRRAAAVLVDDRNELARPAIAALADVVARTDPAEAAWMRETARHLELEPSLPQPPTEQRRNTELVASLGPLDPRPCDEQERAAIVERLARGGV